MCVGVCVHREMVVVCVYGVVMVATLKKDACACVSDRGDVWYTYIYIFHFPPMN